MSEPKPTDWLKEADRLKTKVEVAGRIPAKYFIRRLGMAFLERNLFGIPLEFGFAKVKYLYGIPIEVNENHSSIMTLGDTKGHIWYVGESA